MTETTFTTTAAASSRDIVLAGVMIVLAVGLFWYLDGLFHVSAHLWYTLFYLGVLSPFISLVLHARPFIIKLSLLLVMATVVFLS
jgi:hypothetical protein